MNKSPAFQFYAADYLADEAVQLMSLKEEGVYIRLIAYCWREGSIPADPKLLSRLCKGADVETVEQVTQAFEAHPNEPGRLIHPRLEKERAKQSDNRAARASSGSIGGSKRAERIARAKELGDHTKEEWGQMKAFFGECVRCSSKDSLTKDHIVPIYQGGSNGLDNIQPLCSSCNSSKGPDRTDLRLPWCQANNKQMPSEWAANATRLPEDRQASTKQTASKHKASYVATGSSSSSSSISSSDEEKEIYKEAPKEEGKEKQSSADSQRILDQQAEDIYQAYPRKAARPAALKAIKSALKRYPFDFLLSCTKRYAISRAGQDPSFTPHPATWFGQERYNDDPTTWGQRNQITEADRDEQRTGIKQTFNIPRL